MAAISPIILFDRVLNTGIAPAVLADALSVGTILFAPIEIFGPVSGAHFNDELETSGSLHSNANRRWIDRDDLFPFDVLS